MIRSHITFVVFLFFVCTSHAESLQDVRGGYRTVLINKVSDPQKMSIPPKEELSIIEFSTEFGNMSAYISNTPKDNKKHPAIIWITGGFPVGVAGETAWEPQPIENDQSAKLYREFGLIEMYPSFRGTAGNPGNQEGFYGEVNDVISALKYLQKLDCVDKNQIYLGGHSTGGTLALLVAESTNEFKAVFSFGPVFAPISYGDEYAFHNPLDIKENKLRAPGLYLNFIKSETYIIEGSDGNIQQLNALKESTSNKNISFIEINGSSHFNLLYPINRLLARKILQSPNSSLAVSQNEFQNAFSSL